MTISITTLGIKQFGVTNISSLREKPLYLKTGLKMV